mmetsp:Transcript_24583/g.70154  ORF Transcript_24583/g.70154 Transcript_24583/m.70154 type:complete len:205 (+) Transcript_24583:494-1108(+)
MLPTCALHLAQAAEQLDEEAQLDGLRDKSDVVVAHHLLQVAVACLCQEEDGAGLAASKLKARWRPRQIKHEPVGRDDIATGCVPQSLGGLEGDLTLVEALHLEDFHLYVDVAVPEPAGQNHTVGSIPPFAQLVAMHTQLWHPVRSLDIERPCFLEHIFQATARNNAHHLRKPGGTDRRVLTRGRGANSLANHSRTLIWCGHRFH